MPARDADDFAVRPYVKQDEARLLELLQRVWARKHDVEKHVRERWWWQWPEPPLYVVEDSQGGLIGVCAYIPFTLRAGGRDVPSAWFVDFYVLAEHQGRGLGRRLTQAVEDRFAMTASLSQTAMAWRVFEKMGWRQRTPVRLYVSRFPMRWLFRTRPAGVRVRRVAMDAAREVTGDLDGLWTRVRDRYACLARRTSAHVLERFACRGERKYELLCAYRDEECAGYMVVRTVCGDPGGRPSHGLIVDYLVDPTDSDAFNALLSDAASRLLDDGVTRIYALSTVPRFERTLGSKGFLSPTTPVVGRYLRANTKWLTYYAKADVDDVDPAGWFLTLGDCDIDYAW